MRPAFPANCSRRRIAALALAGAIATSAGCSSLQGLLGLRPSAASAGSRIDPESRIDRFALALVIHKSQQTLAVYRHGTIVGQYPVALGQKAIGDKLFEGDLRTPEGLYRIIGKHDHPRWQYFLEMDYPNDRDRERYQANLREGRIPIIRSKPQTIGGEIGIHGSDRIKDQKSGRNWTRGCVALSNADITKIHRLVKIGTPVLLLP